MTLGVPVKGGQDSSVVEVNNIKNWTAVNRMTLNFSKTWEMVVRGKISKPLPSPVIGVERRDWLKLLGVTFHENPCNWDLQIDNLLCKASRRLYILRVCKYYGYSKDQLSALFDSLIMSLFLYGIEVWGSAYEDKYLNRIDRFCKRAFKFGYTTKYIFISDVIANRDDKMWKRIACNPNHSLYDLLPPKRGRELRKRGHKFILPKVRTERFKRTFINRCLFNFI